MSWKIKKLFQVPPKRERTKASLPTPPEGMDWHQNAETREWRLVAKEDLPSGLANSEVTEAAANGTKHDRAPEETTVAKETVESVDQSTNQFEEQLVAPPTAAAATVETFANPFHLTESPVTSNDDSIPEHEAVAAELVLKPLSEFHKESSKSSSKSSSTGSSRVLLNMPPDDLALGEEECKSNDLEYDDPDWELLSDRVSVTQSGIAFVSRTGSISSHTSFSASYKMHRTPSSSTIDSHDLLNLGPSGKGVLGVDYVEHIVLPTDTLQGLCLTYKLSASRLKRANHFTGDSLMMAPKQLVVPISKKAMRQGYLRVQDTDSKEYKMHAIQAKFPECCLTEAKAHLELADWVLKDAFQSVKEDYEWEANLKEDELRAGEIRVMMNVETGNDGSRQINFAAQGAGYSPPRRGMHASPKPVDPKAVHAKSVKLEDIHFAAPQSGSYGVEMQSLSKNRANNNASP